MARTKLGARRVVALAFAALLLPLVAFVAPAGADAPVATTTRIFFSEAFAGAIKVNARVRPKTGLQIPQGTVTFYEVGNPEPLDDPIPVDSSGRAGVNVAVNKGPTPVHYRAEFHATGDFADSQAVDTDGGELVVTGKSTFLVIGGAAGLLSLNLTTSAYVRRADGMPEENAIVQFTLGANPSSPAGATARTICFDYTDSKGFASCGGLAGGVYLNTLLGQKAWASAFDYPNRTYTIGRLPIIAFGD